MIHIKYFNFNHPNLSVCYAINNAPFRTNNFSITKVENWANAKGHLEVDCNEMVGGVPKDSVEKLDFEAWFHTEFLTDTDLVNEFLKYELIMR